MNKFNLTYLDNDAVVEFKWENIKNAIQIEVNNIMPKKSVNLINKIKYPWCDKELIEIHKLRDYYFELYNSTSDINHF